MTKIRNILFGYRIENGKITAYAPEAKTVCRIFDMYASGYSLSRIAKVLNSEKVCYSITSSAWDKIKVSRILGNSKYVGNDGYPAVISREIYKKAAVIKASRKNIKANTEPTIRVYCRECGSKMTKLTRQGRKSLCCSACGYKVYITREELTSRFESLLEAISTNPSLLISNRQAEDAAIKPDLKLYELRKELSRQDFDQDEILAKIFEIAEIDYNASVVGSEISEKIIRKQIEQATADGKLPIEFIKERTEKVCLDRDGCITLRLTTGADISERSHIYGSHKNTEENGYSD